MKIIKDNVCYVEMEDIDAIGGVPKEIEKYIKYDASKSKFFHFVCFTGDEAISFFKNKEYILNYDDVKELSDEKLEEKFREIMDKLNKYASKWLNASEHGRKKLDRDKEYNNDMRVLKNAANGLKRYSMERITYDVEVERLFTDKNIRLK